MYFVNGCFLTSNGNYYIMKVKKKLYVKLIVMFFVNVFFTDFWMKRETSSRVPSMGWNSWKGDCQTW